MESSDHNPQENPSGMEFGHLEEETKENQAFGWLKNSLIFLVLLAVVVASFWISFQLGKRILIPVKKPAEQKIDVAVPEPPPDIQAMQKLQEVMSEEGQKQGKSVTATPEPAVPEVKAAVPKPAAPKPVAAKKITPVAKAVVTAPKISAGKRYYKVQAGWFRDKAKAEELADLVQENGFEIYLKKVNSGWRVQVGAFRTKDEAEALRAALAKKNLSSQVLFE
jgi:cell division protein FtsN